MAKWNFVEQYSDDFAERKNEQTLNVVMSSGHESNESVLHEAKRYFKAGRKALYQSVACTIIWYEMSKNDKAYISQVFKPFSSKEGTHPYTTAFKATTGLDEVKQASTISKLKNAAKNLIESSDFKDRAITEFSEKLLDEMVQYIEDAGGLDQLAKAHLGAGNRSNNQRMKQAEVDKEAKQYHDLSHDIIETIQLPDGVELLDSRFVALVGRIKADQIELVDIASNDAIIEYFIRATK